MAETLTSPSLTGGKHTPRSQRDQRGRRPRSIQMPVMRTVMIVWVAVGMGPFFLQLRSFAGFVTPHEITTSLIAPANATMETTDLFNVCPATSMVFAGARWNICPTHYCRLQSGVLCHIVVPQYNTHGSYFIMNRRTTPHRTTPPSCADDSFPFYGNFYHGSIGYYSIYAEESGTFCRLDNTSYVTVSGLGTYDINGLQLVMDRGGLGYRRSYWYIFTGTAFILVRSFMLRRSFVSCRRFAQRCDQMAESIRIQEAVVYVQESMRLSAHGAKNFHRTLLLFLLVDQGVMSDFFLLSTQEGLFGRIQAISLGYHLSGVMSMMFEMVETMNWMSETLRCQVKRLLFNYETVLIGEFITAVVLQYYLTSLSRSRLKDTEPAAEVVSYYLMGLIGHIVLALGCLTIIVFTRAVGAIGFVWWMFGTSRVLTKACSVDAALGARSKMILLSGYVWENGELYYRARTLKALGIMKAVEPDGKELFVHTTLHWVSIPKQNFAVLGAVENRWVEPIPERPCSSILSLFDRELGGDTTNSASDIGDSLLLRSDSPGRQCCFKCWCERASRSSMVTPGPARAKVNIRALNEDHTPRQLSPGRGDRLDLPGLIEVCEATQQDFVESRIELKSIKA
ncbi:unnamed protein product [Phytophthora fragariaefolia]|uniref:Unnamed protein product n=1 Tax=Phytophthora fragariaefolia TaxID=1490495 RepID=A0A9W6X4Y1_9STRA|nr:unnamed protein product [Phytophthora fragariaefolia]